MASTDVQRKLTAIFCTDVVGYSRLMGEDPEGTLGTLTEFRQVFSENIEKYKGRIVNAPGDSILAEFGSVLDAVSCAVDVQRELAERNMELPDTRRMDFRIGVNLGDVLVKDGALYGDGVNVAARLESLAEPGGISISRPVYDQVKTRLPLHFEFLGEHQAKNIAEPVRAYQVRSKPGDAARGAPQAREPAKNQEYPELPGEPSLAVLAFTNMSGDPEQGYFGDGLAEDIITDLSKLIGLTVIARNSSFSYKGRHVQVKQIGREMGVRYVLEGSVRKSGERVRITAQLVEAATGKHVWAERYDRKLEDVFQVQDEITNDVVTTLDVKLAAGEQARVWRGSLKNPRARELFYRAREQINRFAREASEESRRLFKEVTELEPNSPLGYSGIAWANFADFIRGWSDDPVQSVKNMAEWASKGAAVDEQDALTQAMLGIVCAVTERHDQGVMLGSQAVALAPNYADVVMIHAMILLMSNQFEEALTVARKGVRLCPLPPGWYIFALGSCLYFTGRYEEALETEKLAIAREPDYSSLHYAITLHNCALGRFEEARAAAEAYYRSNTGLPSLKEKSLGYPFKDRSVIDMMLAHLEKAGIE